MALSLLPKNRVVEGFAVVQKRAAKYSELRPFTAYFKRQWFKVFNPDLWCVGSSDLRTNNATECEYKFNGSVIQLSSYKQ